MQINFSMDWSPSYVVFLDLGNSKMLPQLRFFIGDMNNCLSISYYGFDSSGTNQNIFDTYQMSQV